MRTSHKQAKTRRQLGIRLPLVLAGLGIMTAMSAGPAFSSGRDGVESYEHPGSGRVESKFYGTVEKIPSDRAGSWTVNGREIVVNRETRIKEEYGKAMTGAYVEVEGTTTGKVFTAEKIEVKRAKK
jgi:hypothetical protein